MKPTKLIVLALAAVTAATTVDTVVGQATSALRYDTKTHKVIRPAPNPSGDTPDLDFTLLTGGILGFNAVSGFQDPADPTKTLAVDIHLFPHLTNYTWFPSPLGNSVSIFPSLQGTQTAGPVGSVATGVNADGSVAYGYPARVMIAAKNVAILTAGAPADLATLSIPTGIARFRFVGSSNAQSASTIVTETQTGTPAAGVCEVHTASGGGGATVISSTAPGSGAGTAVGWPANNAGQLITGANLYIRQTVNSANAATLSFYVEIEPLP